MNQMHEQGGRERINDSREMHVEAETIMIQLKSHKASRIPREMYIKIRAKPMVPRGRYDRFIARNYIFEVD